IEMVRSEITVEGLIPEQVVSDDENGVPDRHGRPARAASRRQPSVLGREVGAPCPGCRVSRLDQERAEPGTAFAGPAALAFAGALTVARTHPGPGGKMVGGRETRHVQPDFG